MKQPPLVSLLLLLLAPVLVLGLSSGCDSGRPDRVQVSGLVLVDGEPLSVPDKGFAHIQFVPADARPATGQIDSEGRFELTTFGDEGGADGCVFGKHKVAVTAYEQLGPSSCRWLVPKKYRSHRTSDITVTIDEATDSLEIHVSWDGGEPFVERFDTRGDSDPMATD